MPATCAEIERPVHEVHRSPRDLQERQRAARIQRSFLPALPVVSAPGFAFTGFFQPADGLGGDFYDVCPLENGRVAFYLADVSGHDLAAALVTVWLRQLLHGLRSHNRDLMLCPAGVFEYIQRSMISDNLDQAFLTMAYGVLDPSARVIRYATAGHPTPLRLFSDGVRSIVEANGPILSPQFGPEIGWTEKTMRLEHGDGLLLFSDGVVDLCDREGQALGPSGLRDAAMDGFSDGRSAQAIGEAVQRIAGHRPAEDDLTLLLLSIE